MKKVSSFSGLPQRATVIRRQQPSTPAWKRPRVWFWFIIVAFSFNLLIAVVTIERHISVSTPESSSAASFEMDRPRMNTLSSRWKKGQSKAQFLTESRIWHRLLLQQQEQNQEPTTDHALCRNGNNQTRAENRQSLADGSKGGTIQLPPFGFHETVRAYVREHEDKSSTSKGLYCLAPPSKPSCQSSQYTVLIYSSGSSRKDDDVGKDSVFSTNRYWRNMVVMVMKFLAYPSVQRVNLVLLEPTTQSNIESLSSANRTASGRAKTPLEDSANRNKYAKRVLNWSRKGVVNVVTVTSLWEAIDRLEVPTESVLWIDGDYRPNGLKSTHNTIANGTVLTHRFRAWREAPNALAIPKESRILKVPPLQQANPRNRSSKKHNSKESVCEFPLLHEMIMHANYLCYLNHPVVGSELRNYTDSVRLRRRTKSSNSTELSDYDEKVSWDITTIAIGMLLFSIGDGYVIEDAGLSSDAAAAYRPLFPRVSVAGEDGTLATRAQDISKYFGCPCSMPTPRLFPSNTRQCSSR